MVYCKLCGMEMRSVYVGKDITDQRYEHHCKNVACAALTVKLTDVEVGDDFTWCIQQINDLKKQLEAMK